MKIISIRILILIAAFTILFCVNINYSVLLVDTQGENKSNATNLGLPGLFSKVENSVIQVTATVNVTDPYGSSLGSGFIYDKNGHVITNYHVIAQAPNTDDIIVTFQDGSAFNAKLIASDP